MYNADYFQTPLTHPNPMLAYFQNRIAEQQSLLQEIQRNLPGYLATQVRHSLLQEGKLLIYTDSAIWASQLRFYSPLILTRVKQLNHPAESVQIKVLTIATGVALNRPRKAKLPSATTIAQIGSDSQLCSDPQLRQSLLKLSATMAKCAEKNQSSKPL